MNLHFFERLRLFRETMPLTQDEMAKAIDMSKRSYCAYEAGDTAPSAKLLAALAIMGADVGYLLTGIRTAPQAEESQLTRGERATLEHYRQTNAEGQKIIEQTAFFAAQSAQKVAGKERA